MTLLVLADPADPYIHMLSRAGKGARVVTGNTVESLAAAAPEAGAILHWSASKQLLEQVWRLAPNVRWVHSRAAGVETVLFPDLIESRVPLTNSRGVFSGSLGEFVMAAVLFFAKDLPRMRRNQRDAKWEPFEVQEVRGRTMGVVGYGDIGRAAAERAHAFGMKVAALRRRPELSREDPLLDCIFPVEQRAELAAISDYLVLAAPLTPESRGLIGEAEISRMKPGAVLINVGRGPVVDEAALIRALEQQRIRGAALDVFEEEPLAKGHPFWRMDNVLLSPHCADHTDTWLADAMELFLDNFERFRRGESLRNLVDKKAGY